MENRFHNRTVAEIAQLAFEAQQRMQAAEEDLEACKLKLIEIASGSKMQINVPNVCKVTVNEPPKPGEKKRYAVNSDRFEMLDYVLRQQLIDKEVITEAKKTDEARGPSVRVLPV